MEVLDLLLARDMNQNANPKLATYDTTDGLSLMRNFTDFEVQATQSMQNKIFKVIMYEGMPFLRKM